MLPEGAGWSEWPEGLVVIHIDPKVNAETTTTPMITQKRLLGRRECAASSLAGPGLPRGETASAPVVRSGIGDSLTAAFLHVLQRLPAATAPPFASVTVAPRRVRRRTASTPTPRGPASPRDPAGANKVSAIVDAKACVCDTGLDLLWDAHLPANPGRSGNCTAGFAPVRPETRRGSFNHATPTRPIVLRSYVPIAS